MSKKTLLYILVNCIFIAILVFSNTLIVIMSGKYGIVKKIPLSSFETYGDNPKYNIEKSIYRDDLIQNYFIYGWAFLADEKPRASDIDRRTLVKLNPEKSIILYLVSDQYIYEIKTAQTFRDDVLIKYCNTYNVVGIMHGFIVEFPTVSIREGIYFVYIKIMENENVSSLRQTYYRFEKTNSGFHGIESIELPD